MPDTLCRNCGNELEIESICSQCDQPIQQKCNDCGYKTFEQIHLDCALGLEMIREKVKNKQIQR